MMTKSARRPFVVVSTLVTVVGLLHCVADPPVLPEPIVITNEAAPPTTPETGPTPGVDAGCPAGQTACNGVCTNLLIDPAHCGVCTIACSTGQVCLSGACGLSCQPGLSLCTPKSFVPDAGGFDAAGVDAASLAVPLDGGPTDLLSRCVDKQNDNEHCGACNNVCAADQACAGGTCRTFTSCAEIAANKGPVADGRYMIKPNGDAGANGAFEVYCAGMLTKTPKEYIELARTGDTANFTQYTGGGACGCAGTPMRRYYTKIRINPATLFVDQTDFTYTTLSTATALACWQGQGGACAGSLTLGYGIAANCTNTQADAGLANVDLRGTPFHVDPATPWAISGFNPYGSATFDGQRKVVDIVGGGFCGFNSPNHPSNGGLLLRRD